MKSLLKKLIPPFLLLWYHLTLAYLGTARYGFPSDKLIVIGVTGTNGKSTVVNLIGRILVKAGLKVCWTSTVNFYINGKTWLNDQKMTMPGRFTIQKFLAESLAVGCQYAIIETSSEGIKQYRHLGINYDIVVFTNLTPEHIESHGSFDNYKKAKGKLFQHLTEQPKKNINGKVIDKIMIVNRDSEYADYFLNFPADEKITYSIDSPSDLSANQVELKGTGSKFYINLKAYETNLPGKVNIYNCLAAIAVAKTQNISDEILRKALANYQGTPGRFEWINEGQNFKIMIDYAPEPESMKRLYETLKLFKFNNLIHVLGSTGGGRDKSRRPVLGKLAAENAKVVIVTNEDPYDEDPPKIIDQVARGAEINGKILNQDLFKILDRKEAIQKALSLARENDLVLITGKGSEQFICVAGGKKIPWDDREEVREELKNTQCG